MTLVKICGNTNLEDCEAALEAGADLLGFVFCEGPRRVEPSQVSSMLAQLPPKVSSVGVFCQHSLAEVRRIGRLSGVGRLQLHGEFSAAEALSLLMPTIRVFKLSGPGDTRAIEWGGGQWVLLDSTRETKPLLVAMREQPNLQDQWFDPTGTEGGRYYFKFYGRYEVYFLDWRLATMGNT